MITEMMCTPVQSNGVVLDLEHGVFNPETVYACIQMGVNMNRHVLVRIPPLKSGSGMIARMALDAGASGIILSTVESQSQALEFLDMCLYDGERGQGLVRENDWDRDTDLNYLRGERDGELILIPQIETRKGYDNLDRIMDERFAYYMIGPYDLSASVGCPGEFDNPEFVQIMENIHKKVGYQLAYHLVEKYISIEDIRLFVEKCGFLAISMDTLFIKEGMDRIIIKGLD